MRFNMTCEEFVKTLESEWPVSVTNACDESSGYEFELNMYSDRDGEMWIITDSDTCDKIVISDPENMEVEY